MRPFFEMISFHFMVSRTRDVFQILSTRQDGLVPKLQAIDLLEATGALTKKKEVASKVWNRSAAVYETLQCVTYLYLGTLTTRFQTMRFTQSTITGKRGSCTILNVQAF